MTASDSACPLTQAIKVFKRTAKNIRANGGQGFCPFVRTGHAKNVMSGADQFLDDGSADESGCASDKHTHEQSLQVSLGDKSGLAVYSGKVVTSS